MMSQVRVRIRCQISYIRVVKFYSMHDNKVGICFLFSTLHLSLVFVLLISLFYYCC
ncbi:hypothetical protein IC582_014644 [Cucumis melo]